jgi:hypothetical protein
VDKERLRFPRSQEIEDRKQKAVFSYHSQLQTLDLSAPLRTFIRKNELLAIPGGPLGS